MSGFKSTGIFISDRATGSADVSYSDALNDDLQRYHEITAPTKLDSFIMDNCVLDYSLNWRLSKFNEDKKISFLDKTKRQEVRRIKDLSTHIGKTAFDNFEIIEEYGTNRICSLVANEITEAIPSDLYPGYKQPYFELLSRKSLSAAYLPFYERLISSSDRCILDVQPTEEDIDEFSANAFAGIFVLTHLLDLSTGRIGLDRRYTFEGFINEIDLLGQITMYRANKFLEGNPDIVTTDEGEFVSTAWTFPSAFIDDVAGEKVDGQELNVHVESGQIADSLIDIKRTKGGKNTTLAPTSITKRTARRINAISSGSVNANGQIMPGIKAMYVYGVESEKVLRENGYTFYEQSPHLNIQRLYGRGFAQAGVNLADYL